MTVKLDYKVLMYATHVVSPWRVTATCDVSMVYLHHTGEEVQLREMTLGSHKALRKCRGGSRSQVRPAVEPRQTPGYLGPKDSAGSTHRTV